MLITYLLFFITFSAFSETSPQIQVIPNPQNLEDFEHQFKGCLANSECDQVMGLQLSRWKNLISKVDEDKMTSQKKVQVMEVFRSKYGIPVEFYTYQKSQQGFKPMLFNSPCKEHNTKGSPTVFKGTSFLKSMTKDKAIIWRDQAQIEIPLGEILIPQPVFVYKNESGPELYHLPLGDQPLFIKNKDLYLLKEEDGFFYALRVSPNGDWKIENLDLSQLSRWEDKRSEVKCPKDEKNLAPNIFNVGFCKTIWDEDSKKTVIVKLHQGCVN
jgi:hypothetical protein